MLHTFISSQARHLGAARLGGVSLSVVTHAGLITLAAIGSGKAASLGDLRGDVIPAERVLFVSARELTNGGASVARAVRAARAKGLVRLVVPDLTRLRASIDAAVAALADPPAVVTDINLDGRIADAHDFDGFDEEALIGGSVLRALARPGENGAYSSEMVERTVWPKRGNPTPRYPPALLHDGVEGTFAVQFVVDSTGRVDAKTMAFPKSAHPMFVRAIRDALLRSRYFPAELAGGRVRQLVQQQFTFVIGRGRS